MSTLSYWFPRFLFLLVFSAVIAGCSTTGQSTASREPVDESGSYKFDAWRPDRSAQYEAINLLLEDADVLIEKHEYEAATDKLERVLRIMPSYAPAWSRLSWLALQTDRPKRAVEMAKRSNSLAYSRPELQSLNWAFIRSASELLQDRNLFNQADQQIKSLQAF